MVHGSRRTVMATFFSRKSLHRESGSPIAMAAGSTQISAGTGTHASLLVGRLIITDVGLSRGTPVGSGSRATSGHLRGLPSARAMTSLVGHPCPRRQFTSARPLAQTSRAALASRNRPTFSPIPRLSSRARFAHSSGSRIASSTRSLRAAQTSGGKIITS